MSWKHHFHVGWYSSPHSLSCKVIVRQYFTVAQVVSLYFWTVWSPHSPKKTLCNFWFWSSWKTISFKVQYLCRVWRTVFDTVLLIFRQILSSQLLKIWFWDFRTLLIMAGNILSSFNNTFYLTFMKHIKWFYVHNRVTYRRIFVLIFFFHLIHVKRIIWIICSLNFI